MFIGRRTRRVVVLSVIVLGVAAGIAYATIPVEGGALSYDLDGLRALVEER